MGTAALVLAGVLIAVDQLIKLWAIRSLAPVGSITVIRGLLDLTYVENRGAAYGILQGKQFFLIAFTSVIIIGAIWLLFSKKLESKLQYLCVSLIIAGGIGNLIDRVMRGFVVDYFDISSLFQFPVFNFADCCVVIGAFLLMAYVIFFDDAKDKKKIQDPEEKNQ